MGATAAWVAMEILVGLVLFAVGAAVYVYLTYLLLVYLLWPGLPYLVLGGFALGIVLVVVVFVATLVGIGARTARVVGPSAANDRSLFPPTRTAFPRDRAWPHYLLGQARTDLWTAWSNGVGAITAGWRWSDAKVRADTRLLWGWPLLLFPLVGLVAMTVGGFAAAVVSLLFCVALLVVPALVWIVVAGALHLADRAIRRQRGARGTCPHRDCNFVSDLPSFRCECGAVHRDVRPGLLGAFGRRCECERLVSTTVLRAGSSMQVLCPKCDEPLPSGAGTLTDIRLAVIGPVSAGKTRFVHAGMMALGQRLSGDDGGFVPADEASERSFRDGAELVAAQAPTTKTPSDRAPKLISTRLTSGSRRALLHLFDPAGELLSEREQNSSLHYLDEAQGFVLVVDPFSVASVADELTGPFAGRLAEAEPAHDDPETSYHVTAQRLRDGGVELERRALAVTVVKADLLLVLPPGVGLGPAAPVIRAWLCERGLENLVFAAERDFGTVEYFLVSSWTGWRADDELTTLTPLLWLAEQAGLRLSGPTAAVPA